MKAAIYKKVLKRNKEAAGIVDYKCDTDTNSAGVHFTDGKSKTYIEIIPVELLEDFRLNNLNL